MPTRTVHLRRPRPLAALRAAPLASLFAALLAVPGIGAGAQPTDPAVVEAIEIATDGSRAEIWISSNAKLDRVSVRVDRDELLALWLPRHIPGPAVEDLFPAEGLIRAVRSTVEQTSRGPLTRVTIRTREPVAHDLSADGNRFRLRVWPRDAESEEATLRRQVEYLQSALTTSNGSRDDLARRLQAMETRQHELDASLTATLNEATEALRGLRTKTEKMAARLRQAGSRESELAQQVARLEASLAESEKTRGQLAARLEREAAVATAEPVMPEPMATPTVQLGTVSPEGFGSVPAAPQAAPASRTSDAGGAHFAAGDYRLIVAASKNEEQPATVLSARLRDRGYASDVYWSTSGYYVVTLDRLLPRDQARRKRDEAVRDGDVAADAYLILGTSLRSRVTPEGARRDTDPR